MKTESYGTRITLMTPEYRYNLSAFEELQTLLGSPTKCFSLNLAICSDSTLRDFLVHQLESAYSQITIVSFWPYTDDVFDHVREKAAIGPHDAVFVSGLDDAIASGHEVEALYQNLNRSPERWKRWFPCPVVFWISEDTADRLRGETKNFWEWHEGIFRLEG